jgi:GNAT superfamily N-acetyltransferase
MDRGGLVAKFRLIRLGLQHMDEVARIHRAAFDAALPWLAGLHTPEEDRSFFRERVHAECEIWGAIEGGRLEAFIAVRDGFVDQLYVLPSAQRKGLGTALLAKAQSRFPSLRLWTFQRNLAARSFYEARGFVVLEETDGAGNEEKEPDALYQWERHPSA